MSVLDITIHRSSTVCTSVLWKRERELLDGAYLGRLGVWGLGLLATKGFDSEGITPWEFWCGSCEVLGGVGCGSLRGCVGCWESGWRIDSFSLVLFLCSANNTSNRFLLPWTALRWVKECVYRPKTTTTKTNNQKWRNRSNHFFCHTSKNTNANKKAIWSISWIKGCSASDRLKILSMIFFFP